MHHSTRPDEGLDTGIVSKGVFKADSRGQENREPGAQNRLKDLELARSNLAETRSAEDPPHHCPAV
jgi:hypothetical protein